MKLNRSLAQGSKNTGMQNGKHYRIIRKEFPVSILTNKTKE